MGFANDRTCTVVTTTSQRRGSRHVRAIVIGDGETVVLRAAPPPHAAEP
jgi:hypothetical protein